MEVLVTGASGFLGSHVVDQLVLGGHRVRALVRPTSRTEPLREKGVRLCVASLEDGSGLDDAVAGVDAVVHGAAMVKARTPEEFYQVNAGGTERLVEAVRRAAPELKRFVYISSLAAHGFSQDGKPREAHALPRPVTHYGKSMLEGERVVLSVRDEWPVTIVRPPAIYGPRDTEMFAFFRLISKRIMPFLGSPKHALSLVYVEDCARAVVDVLTKEHPSGRIYFVEEGRTYTQAEFGAAVARALGVQALSFSVPMEIVTLAAWASELYGRVLGQAVMLTRDKVLELREPHLICCGDAIRAELGWSAAVTLDEGAQRTAQWYRDQGWL